MWIHRELILFVLHQRRAQPKPTGGSDGILHHLQAVQERPLPMFLLYQHNGSVLQGLTVSGFVVWMDVNVAPGLMDGSPFTELCCWTIRPSCQPLCSGAQSLATQLQWACEEATNGIFWLTLVRCSHSGHQTKISTPKFHLMILVWFWCWDCYLDVALNSLIVLL